MYSKIILHFFNVIFKMIETRLNPMNARQQYRNKQLFKEEILKLASVQFVVLYTSTRFK